VNWIEHLPKGSARDLFEIPRLLDGDAGALGGREPKQLTHGGSIYPDTRKGYERELETAGQEKAFERFEAR
jgi:hypothetical protein